MIQTLLLPKLDGGNKINVQKCGQVDNVFYEAERWRIKLDGGNKIILLIVKVYNVELQSAFQVLAF